MKAEFEVLKYETENDFLTHNGENVTDWDNGITKKLAVAIAHEDMDDNYAMKVQSFDREIIEIYYNPNYGNDIKL